MKLPDEPVSPGESVDIPYSLSSLFTHLPGVIVEIRAYFFWNERLLEGFSRSASGEKVGKISLLPLRRGDYLSRSGFILRDHAGFFRFKIPTGREGLFSILPEKSVDEAKLMLRSSGGEHISRKMRTKRSDEMIEVRQYYPGDDSRRINWKAFAHSGELFIRLGEEQPLPESKLLIILDLSAPKGFIGEPAGGLYLDCIVSALAGIIEELRAAGQSFELAVLPSPPEAFSGLRRLCGLEWTDSASFSPPSFPVSTRRASHGSSCLLLTSPFSENFLQTCRSLGLSGQRVTAVVPVPGDFQAESGRVRRLFLTPKPAHIAGFDRKTAGFIRAEAIGKCRELKLRGGAADAFIL